MTLRIARRSLVLAAPLLAACGLVPSLAEEAEAADPIAAPFAPVSATDVVEADLLWQRRPVIIFADSPRDPDFIRQLEILPEMYAQLEARDVILITDTDPAAPSELRRKLRPRGFSLVMMDKDWKNPVRRPSPRPAREVINTIDRMPIARTEALERNPAGR